MLFESFAGGAPVKAHYTWWERLRHKGIEPPVGPHGEKLLHKVCPSYDPAQPETRHYLPFTAGTQESLVIGIIGAKFSGKSHYIAALIDRLEGQTGLDMHAGLFALTDETTDRYQREFRDPLFGRKLELPVTVGTPPPLIYDLVLDGALFDQQRHRAVTLALYDTAGENFDDPATVQKMVRYLRVASGVIFLIDPLQCPPVREAVPASVPLPNLELMAEPNEVLNRVLTELQDNKLLVASGPLTIPVAVVLTKCDVFRDHGLIDLNRQWNTDKRHISSFDLQAHDDMNGMMGEYVQQWSTKAYATVTSRFPRHAFFGVSATGCASNRMTRRYPFVSPWRVEDPLLWLLADLGVIPTAIQEKGSMTMPAEQLIFTDWPRGKGVDPSASGLQIVACSDGLSTEARWSLSNLCMHLGQAYSMSNAPRAAVQLEQTWLSQTMDRRPRAAGRSGRVSGDLELRPGGAKPGRFDAGPVYRLHPRWTHRELLCPRAGVRPRGAERNRRQPPGVVSVGNLPNGARDNGTTLPTVASLAPSSLPSADLSVLAADPYREHLAAMISALCSARLACRPVLICLAAWQSATPLAEALLDLVPPAERRMTTFSTYESDRTWTPASKTGRRTGAEPAHQVIILCGQGDRMWNLRSDEYQSVYAVFNFVEGRVSELGSPRPYAAFAAEHVLAGDGDTLRVYYQLLDQLGAGADPDAWDRLTPAASLSQGSVASDALAQAAQALAGIAERPQAARTALSLLSPHVNSLAQTDNSDAIISLAPSLATLLSCLRTPELTAAAAASPAAGDPASVLQSLADEALAVGRARTAPRC